MTDLTLIPTLPVVAGPLSRHPAAVYLASLGAGSRRTMHQALDAIAGLMTGGQADALALPWERMRYEHAVAIRAALSERYAAATANKMLSALRGVLKTAWHLGLMTAEDCQRARSVRNVGGSVLPAGRALTAGEIEALLNVCANDPTPAGARDGALIAVLRAGGLRRAEVCTLALADYNPADDSLTVRGKRNKQRIVYLIGGAVEALSDWLAYRGSGPGPLFCPVAKGGRVITGQGVTSQAVYNALAKRARESGVKELSPHDLRRTFVGDLLDLGADIATVQRLAGHENIQTTARYDRRGEEAKRRAVAMLHVPWRRPRMAGIR